LTALVSEILASGRTEEIFSASVDLDEEAAVILDAIEGWACGQLIPVPVQDRKPGRHWLQR